MSDTITIKRIHPEALAQAVAGLSNHPEPAVQALVEKFRDALLEMDQSEYGAPPWTWENDDRRGSVSIRDRNGLEIAQLAGGSYKIARAIIAGPGWKAAAEGYFAFVTNLGLDEGAPGLLDAEMLLAKARDKERGQ